jgi:hypothetical protein
MSQHEHEDDLDVEDAPHVLMECLTAIEGIEDIDDREGVARAIAAYFGVT